jgi:pimeloyl-ACP methyl ester carboxylesterase
MSSSQPPVRVGRSAREHFLETGKATLWYEEERPGDTLLLLGGFTAGHYVFDLVRPHLAERFRLIAWEPRGLGRSERVDPVTNPYSTDVWAEDLSDLCVALGTDRVCIWAQGFASYYAIRFAARWPDRVMALVTYTDIWAQDPVKGYPAIWNVYRAIVENFGITPFGARMLAHLFDVATPDWFYDWEQKNILETLHSNTVAATVGYCLTEADVRSDLERLTMPVLVLQGDIGWNGQRPADDPSLALMRHRIPNLEVVVVEGSHPGYVLIQKPQECATVAAEFFTRALERMPIVQGEL